MAEDAQHAAVVESLKATASELQARAHEDMNDDWADRMADGLAAAGLLAAPAPSVDAIERIRQIIADHCFGPHVDSVAELRALEIAAACTDDMVDEGLLAAPAAQPAPFTDLTARLAAADAGWGMASGDGPSNPDYIRFLAAQVDAFEDRASPAAPAAQPDEWIKQVENPKELPGLLLRMADLLDALESLPASLRRCADVARIQANASPAVPADDEAAAKSVHDAMCGCDDHATCAHATSQDCRAVLAALRR